MKKPKRVSKKALALLRLKSGKVTMAKTGNIESYDGMLVLKGLRSPFATSDEGLVETKVRKIPHCKFCGKPRKGHPRICPRSKPQAVPVQVQRFPIKTLRAHMLETLPPVRFGPIGYRHFSDWVRYGNPQ